MKGNIKNFTIAHLMRWSRLLYTGLVESKQSKWFFFIFSLKSIIAEWKLCLCYVVSIELMGTNRFGIQRLTSYVLTPYDWGLTIKFLVFWTAVFAVMKTLQSLLKHTLVKELKWSLVLPKLCKRATVQTTKTLNSTNLFLEISRCFLCAFVPY